MPVILYDRSQPVDPSKLSPGWWLVESFLAGEYHQDFLQISENMTFWNVEITDEVPATPDNLLGYYSGEAKFYGPFQLVPAKEIP